jgi:hypothetical protein
MVTGPKSCRLRDYHPLWSAIPNGSARIGFVTPQCFRNPDPKVGLG